MSNLNTTFEIGKAYKMSWIGDSDLKTIYTVIKRTAKFVTLVRENSSEPVRVGIKIYDGSEYCSPTGSYSMSPSLYATKEVTPEQPKEAKPEPTRIEYKGFIIIDSDQISGWFMTVCGNVVGGSLSEIKYDIDGTARAQAYEENTPLGLDWRETQQLMRIV